MKKLVLLCAIVLFGLTACQRGDNTTDQNGQATDQTTMQQNDTTATTPQPVAGQAQIPGAPIEGDVKTQSGSGSADANSTQPTDQQGQNTNN